MIENILSNTREFSFIQLMRLLQQVKPAEIDFEDFIKIRPELSLDFPRSDIANIIENSDGSYTLDATFLGLYGSSSPLPTFYTEELIAEENEGFSSARNFIDIINNNLYHMLFQIWSKYKLAISMVENKNEMIQTILYSFLGLGHKDIRNQIPNHYSLIKYAGLFIHNPRTSGGLKAIIMEHLETDDVEVIECVARMVKIPQDQQLLLGISGAQLGIESHIGKQIKDINGKFKIKVKANDFNQLQNILPINIKIFTQLKVLIDFYLTDPLEWDYEIEPTFNKVTHLQLGNKTSAHLGMNSWLGNQNITKSSIIFKSSMWGNLENVS